MTLTVHCLALLLLRLHLLVLGDHAPLIALLQLLVSPECLAVPLLRLHLHPQCLAFLLVLLCSHSLGECLFTALLLATLLLQNGGLLCPLVLRLAFVCLRPLLSGTLCSDPGLDLEFSGLPLGVTLSLRLALTLGLLLLRNRFGFLLTLDRAMAFATSFPRCRLRLLLLGCLLCSLDLLGCLLLGRLSLLQGFN